MARGPLIVLLLRLCVGASLNNCPSTRSEGGSTTMKVLGASEFGRRHLAFSDDRPRPDPSSPTDLLIRVEYSDLNPVDHHKLESKPDGTPTPSDRTPFVVGFGGSGVVEAVSADADEVSASLLNERVCFLADPSRDGSYAEYVLCDRRLVAVIPKGVEMHAAACVPVAGCTAFESLGKVGLPVQDADFASAATAVHRDSERRRLLIVGGAGGVGSWATQLARSSYGSSDLEIVCTAGSQESRDWCGKMGADVIIGHDEIATKLGGGPKGSVDSIICLAEPTPDLFGALAEVLRPYGKICLVVAGGGIKSLDLSFVFFKCGTVCTETVFSSIRCGYRLDQSEEIGAILRAMEKGAVTAPLAADWDEDRSDWRQASEDGGYIDMVATGHTRGKLVMKIGG